MNKDDKVYLQDMLATAHKLRAMSVTREQYENDETLQAASRYWVQIIGEAANHVSLSFQQEHPKIAWRAIIGMRNRIVHDYLGIDNNIIWEVMTRNMIQLIEQLEALLDE